MEHWNADNTNIAIEFADMKDWKKELNSINKRLDAIQTNTKDKDELYLSLIWD